MNMSSCRKIRNSYAVMHRTVARLKVIVIILVVYCFPICAAAQDAHNIDSLSVRKREVKRALFRFAYGINNGSVEYATGSFKKSILRSGNGATCNIRSAVQSFTDKIIIRSDEPVLHIQEIDMTFESDTAIVYCTLIIRARDKRTKRARTWLTREKFTLVPCGSQYCIDSSVKTPEVMANFDDPKKLKELERKYLIRKKSK